MKHRQERIRLDRAAADDTTRVAALRVVRVPTMFGSPTRAGAGVSFRLESPVEAQRPFEHEWETGPPPLHSSRSCSSTLNTEVQGGTPPRSIQPLQRLGMPGSEAVATRHILA